MFDILKNAVLSFRFRQRIHNEMDLIAPSEPDFEIDAEALLAKILRVAQTESYKLSSQSSRRQKWSWNLPFSVLVGFPAAVGALILGVWFTVEDTGQPPTYKSTSQNLLVIPPSLVTFAVISEQGVLNRGREGQKIPVSHGILFSVETPGLNIDDRFKIDIFVEDPDGKVSKIITHSMVTKMTEPLKGKHGYIEFKAEQPGKHRFYGKRSSQGIEEDIAGFSLEFIPD